MIGFNSNKVNAEVFPAIDIIHVFPQQDGDHGRFLRDQPRQRIL